jgi:hypothetical protein
MAKVGQDACIPSERPLPWSPAAYFPTDYLHYPVRICLFSSKFPLLRKKTSTLTSISP